MLHNINSRNVRIRNIRALALYLVSDISRIPKHIPVPVSAQAPGEPHHAVAAAVGVGGGSRSGRQGAAAIPHRAE